MSEESSVFKICPQCGQSVSVAAKFCPTCGTPFAADAADFVAYERYQTPGTPDMGAAGTGAPPVSDSTMAYPPVDGTQPAGAGEGAPLYPGPDQAAAVRIISQDLWGRTATRI